MGIKDILALNKLIEKFGSHVDDTYDYTFRCTNPSDYEMTLKYKAQGSVMDKVFVQVGRVLGRARPKFAKLNVSDPRVVEKFHVPPEMHNRVHTAVQKNVKEVAKEVKKDGVHILRSGVEDCIFKRVDEEELHIEVKVVGQYVFKR